MHKMRFYSKVRKGDFQIHRNLRGYRLLNYVKSNRFLFNCEGSRVYDVKKSTIFWEKLLVYFKCNILLRFLPLLVSCYKGTLKTYHNTSIIQPYLHINLPHKYLFPNTQDHFY